MNAALLLLALALLVAGLLDAQAQHVNRTLRARLAEGDRIRRGPQHGEGRAVAWRPGMTFPGRVAQDTP